MVPRWWGDMAAVPGCVVCLKLNQVQVQVQVFNPGLIQKGRGIAKNCFGSAVCRVGQKGIAPNATQRAKKHREHAGGGSERCGPQCAERWARAVALDNQAVQTAVSDLRQRHGSAKASCGAALGGRGRVKPKKWRVKKGKSWNFGMLVEVLRPPMTHLGDSSG